MGFSINTNLDALNTYRNLNSVQSSLSNSLAKLSSGLRINNAGDDAAGLTIATQLGAQVSGLQQAARNAQDGVSVVQTADGALTQVQSLLGRLRDLAVQAANDSNSTTARAAITKEASSITDELGRLASSVNFNGRQLLNSNSTLQFQVGADGNASSQIGVDLTKANLSTLVTALKGKYTTFAVASPSTTTGSYTFTSSATTAATATVDFTGGTYNDTQDLVNKLNSTSAFTTAGFTASVDANNKLQVQNADGTYITATAGTGAAGINATGVNSTTTGLQFDTAGNAQASITAIQAQLDNVSAARANIGALENRFASAVSTISTSITNLTAAKSRITDVDMAQEMVSYSRSNILSQSGTAMLAQANSLPQLALKLLQ